MKPEEQLRAHTLIQSIYTCYSATEFYPKVLATLLKVFGADRGLVFTDVHGLKLAACSPPKGWPADLASQITQIGADQTLSAKMSRALGFETRSVLSLRTQSSIWLIGRQGAFSKTSYEYATLLPIHLEYASDGIHGGQKTSIPTQRVNLFVSQTPRPSNLLSGLEESAVAAVKLAARGYTNRQIANHQSISVGTVARRLNRAYRHLGISGRRELDVLSLLDDPKPPRVRPPEES